MRREENNIKKGYTEETCHRRTASFQGERRGRRGTVDRERRRLAGTKTVPFETEAAEAPQGPSDSSDTLKVSLNPKLHLKNKKGRKEIVSFSPLLVGVSSVHYSCIRRSKITDEKKKEGSQKTPVGGRSYNTRKM